MLRIERLAVKHKILEVLQSLPVFRDYWLPIIFLCQNVFKGILLSRSQMAHAGVITVKGLAMHD